MTFATFLATIAVATCTLRSSECREASDTDANAVVYWRADYRSAVGWITIPACITIQNHRESPPSLGSAVVNLRLGRLGHWDISLRGDVSSGSPGTRGSDWHGPWKIAWQRSGAVVPRCILYPHRSCPADVLLAVLGDVAAQRPQGISLEFVGAPRDGSDARTTLPASISIRTDDAPDGDSLAVAVSRRRVEPPPRGGVIDRWQGGPEGMGLMLGDKMLAWPGGDHDFADPAFLQGMNEAWRECVRILAKRPPTVRHAVVDFGDDVRFLYAAHVVTLLDVLSGAGFENVSVVSPALDIRLPAPP